MKNKVLEHKEAVNIKLGNGYTLMVEREDYTYEDDCKDTYYHLVIYYRKKYFVDISDYIKYSDCKVLPNDTIDEIRQKVFNYLNNKWVGIEDLQGCDFKVGDSMTLKEWKEWAISDRNTCDDDYGYSLIKRTPLKHIIKLIEDYWELSIKKIVLVK